MQHRHANMPFHRFRRWNGRYFERHVVTESIRLFHPGGSCPDEKGSVRMHVAHITGIFEVLVYRCRCHRAGVGSERLLPRQLMRHAMVAGTTDNTQISWSFSVAFLDNWLAMTHYSKASMMDFWSATWFNTTGIPPERVRLTQSAYI